MWRRVVAVALVALWGCIPGVSPDKGRYSCAADADCGSGWECRPFFSGGGRCFKQGQCTDEVCNGTDDNCDGQIDEAFPEQGAACDTGLKGVCATGATICAAGALACQQTVQPSVEVCDGLDNNCEGHVDETFDLTTDSSNCGRCGARCDAGTGCASSTCVETACGDGLDNDLNGKTDCDDERCFGKVCLATPPPSHCGVLILPVPPDGGVDAGQPADGGADAGADAGSDAGTLRGCFLPETQCANGYDDDGDGLVDCLDPDCDGLTCFSGTACTQLMCPGPG